MSHQIATKMKSCFLLMVDAALLLTLTAYKSVSLAKYWRLPHKAFLEQFTAYFKVY